MYSKAGNLLTERSCFSNCNSTSNPSTGVDVYHATYFRCSIDKGDFLMELCGFSLCPSGEVSGDETVCFCDNCQVYFRENNFTNNCLYDMEMLAVWLGAKFMEPILFCDFAECVTNEFLTIDEEGTVERSNIVGIKPGVHYTRLFWDKGRTNVKSSVVLGNSHPTLSCFNNIFSEDSFFCRNTFSHPFGEVCMPSFELNGINAHNCFLATSSFSFERKLVPEIQLIFLPIAQLF